VALLWRKQKDGTTYEVRSAGRTRRLYTDGVFHSQLNLGRPVNGGLWDLLVLPAFLVPEGRVRRVLVLGVGGGAVLRQLQHFFEPEVLVGVELDPVHLYVARRFFGLRGRNFELHQADAVAWVESYEGPPFDLIVDDLYGQVDGEPVRAKAGARWMSTLTRRLCRHGVLVMNFVARHEMHGSALGHRAARRFGSIFELTHPLLDNSVAAFTLQPSTIDSLHRRLEAVAELDPRKKTCPLRFQIRQIA
jgi:spermidine synthase